MIQFPFFPFLVTIYFHLFFGKLEPSYSANKFHRKIDIHYPLRFSIPRWTRLIQFRLNYPYLSSPHSDRYSPERKERRKGGRDRKRERKEWNNIVSWRKVNEEKQFRGAKTTFLGTRRAIAPKLRRKRRVIVLSRACSVYNNTVERCFPSIMLNWTVYGSKGNRDSSVVSEIAVSVEKLPNTTCCANLREGKRGLKVGRKLGNGASFNSFLALENYFFLDE